MSTVRALQHLVLALVLIGPATIVRAQQPAAEAVAHARRTTVLRAHPADTAATVAAVPRGAAVALGACDNDWCSVSRAGQTGYVPDSLLVRVPAGATGQGYVNSRGDWVPSPTRTPGNVAPAGASAQCRDGTYSFSRSRRGTCSYHGGVARWL